MRRRTKLQAGEDLREVAIYARKSRITNKGDSIGVQFKQSADYAINQLSLPEDYEFLHYEDKGLSGYYSDRPDFQRLLWNVCASYGGAHYLWPGDPAGSGGAGLLLPLLPGAGGGARAGERGVLLYLHRRIPLSQRGGRRDRGGNRHEVPPANLFRQKGYLQCFQRHGRKNLPKPPRPRPSG